jgi:hypothetical protein
VAKKKPKDMASKAVKRFQDECKEEGLSLECALAQLALMAIRMEKCHREDSWQRTMASLWSVRNEAKNVIRALMVEYPDMKWEGYERFGNIPPHASEGCGKGSE